MTVGGRSKELLSLYKKLLRACERYPSKNKRGIYEAIREEFRDNRDLSAEDEATQKKISVAIKGLSQLQMYDSQTLNNGDSSNPNWSVQLEQNPMPKPDHL
ncbi:hypothetical protein CTEN210_01900 [Chaetoceros tenuissimus]|uniref:Complex 1 LYR protein domain-containing protein n=1 Tax=Chaetoceros tenuissimus TaxID=426638 RepID=A0AAD3CIF4_9STRA|nr:hypothetical protein CTEN210_01900 [Chaetoceros tenuissimus]